MTNTFFSFLSKVFCRDAKGLPMEDNKAHVVKVLNTVLPNIHNLTYLPENLFLESKTYDRGPHFDTSATRNVTSLVGKTAHLNCRIKNLGNKTVSMFKDCIIL